jgi:hypothetical protein
MNLALKLIIRSFGLGHSPLNPLCPSPKTEKFCFAFNNKSYTGNENER